MEKKDQENFNQIVLASQLDHVEISADVVKSENFSLQYESLDNLIKYLTSIQKAVNTEIKKIIEKDYADSGVSSLKSDKYSFSYVAPSTKQTFDVKKFMEENPELYKKYLKISKVSDSLRVTKKKEKKETARTDVIDADPELDF